MLKKFRRLFSQRSPVEFEVHRRPPEGSGLALPPTGASDTPEDGQEAIALGALEAHESLKTVHADLEEQRRAHERMAASIERVEGNLEPLSQRIAQNIESIAGSGNHLAELVETFQSSAQARDESIQASVHSMHASSERQLQVLTVLQQQLDQSQQSTEQLARSFGEVGSGLESLLAQQKETAEQAQELVTVVSEQIDVTNQMHRRLFGVAIALTCIGGLSMLITVILILVYAG